MVLPQPITLEPVREGHEDHSFQYEVYSSTRLEEMGLTGWDDVRQEAFLRMQFMMQQRSYAARYPKAIYQLVYWQGERVGHLLVNRERGRIGLVDIALLPPFRNKGIGTALIARLQEEAYALDVPVVLQVMRFNKAARLYERLGFKKTAENELYVEMTFHCKDPKILL